MIAILLQIGSSLFALVTAHYLLKKHPHLTADNALKSIPAVSLSLAALTACITALIIIIYHDPWAEALPPVFQSYSIHILWSAVAVLFGFVANFTLYLCIIKKHPQARLLTLAIITIFITLSIHYHRSLTAIYSKLTEEKNGDIVLQTSGSSCVAASLANVSNIRGVNLTEKQAAKLLHTTSKGSGPCQLRYALTKLNIPYQTLRLKEPDLKQVHPPAILYVDHPQVGKESHAVTFIATSDKGYEIWDPLIGRVYWSQQDIDSLWHGKGIQCSLNY